MMGQEVGHKVSGQVMQGPPGITVKKLLSP